MDMDKRMTDEERQKLIARFKSHEVVMWTDIDLAAEELERLEKELANANRLLEINRRRSLEKSGGLEIKQSDAEPGHTDLMVSPESIDAFMEANPLPKQSNAEPVACAIANRSSELGLDADGRVALHGICQEELERYDDEGVCRPLAEPVSGLIKARAIALEQRCERGTPWDLACVTIANKIGEQCGYPPIPTDAWRDDND